MRRGFTLVELLVVIAVVALLLGLVLPGLAGARVSGRNAGCLSNLRSTSQAVAAYRADHKGAFPGGWGAMVDSEPRCPAGDKSAASHYLLIVPVGAAAANVADTVPPCRARTCQDVLAWHALRREWWRNAGYLDGHAGRVR